MDNTAGRDPSFSGAGVWAERPGPGAADLAPRWAGAADRAGIIAAAGAVFRPDGGDLAAEIPALFATDGTVRHLVIDEAAGAHPPRMPADAGTPPRAHAALMTRRAFGAGSSMNVGLIGGVFTQPAWRGRGLAAALVGGLAETARREGLDLLLASGWGPLYARLGFSPGPPLTRTDFAAAHAAPDVELRRVGPDDDAGIDHVVRLGRTRPAYLEGNRETVRRVLRAGFLIWGPLSVELAWSPGHALPAAFVAWVRTRSGDVRVVDSAGPRPVTTAAVAALASRLAGRVTWLEPKYQEVPPAEATAEATAPAAGPPVSFPWSFLWLRPAAGAFPPLPWYGLDYA